MKSNVFFAGCFLVLSFSACSDDGTASSDEKKGKQSGTPVGTESFLPKEISDVLKENLPVTEEFSIQPKEFNKLETKNGTIISIPPDAFEGNPASVTIKVKEIFSIKDMILSGMQTVSDKGWLVTSGMIYLQAFSDEKEVFLKEGKSAMVNMPTDRNQMDSRNRVFEGEQTENGILWKESEKNKVLDYIIPFPAAYLMNDMIEFYAADLEPYKDKILGYSADPSLKNVKAVSQYNWWRYEPLEKYKNSLIVTREFQSMFNATAGISDHHEVVDYYFENNDLPLWEVDSMYWPEYEYKDRRHGKVIKLDYEGLDLESDGYSKLIKKGLTEENALLTLSYYQARRDLMKKMEKDPDARFAAQFNSMLVRRMGWINIDRYLDSENEPISLKITVNASSENTMVYLVDKKNKLVIRANRKENVFFFGNDENEKLPIPDRCSIYTFDAANGEFYFYETYLDEGDQQYEVSMEKMEKAKLSEFFKSVME